MANYPFTTIKPNRGVALVRIDCPCASLDGDCSPKSGSCENGTRYVPIDMLDVAGLVPGASEGKGMGNQFLDDLRRADAMIHVIDASGTTDEEGNEVKSYSPAKDVIWLGQELDQWVKKIVFGNWAKDSRKLEQDASKIAEILQDKLSGLGATISMVKQGIKEADLMATNPRNWSEDECAALAVILRELLFPMAIAANKMDMGSAPDHIRELKDTYPEMKIVATSGLAELTLRKADEEGLIDYVLGDSSFSFAIENPEENKKFKVLTAIKERLLDTYGSTGVTELLEHAVFELLNLVAVFPVEDPTHLTDQDGRILPDVFLVPKGTTAKEFAGKVHTDLAKTFIHGVLVTDNNKRVSSDHEMSHGDIIKIVAGAK